MLYKLGIPVDAVQLTVDNMEEVERMCNGRIRGTKLPPKERIVQFDSIWEGEKEIKVDDWLIRFRTPTKIICDVWPNEWFLKAFVGATQEVSYG